ncbi:hepatitis A virus cellular receptor 2 homolog [Oreochromis niloticus]|uniref:hepatitis A virus cellular receptor 2 homolog n=1 Tax=Oreochromis niloticus TaxID=8128 RepID=UPI0009052D33|nr:hepatitis A virus cellular receptor 2 homolog [Oreochromis niloticus]
MNTLQVLLFLSLILGSTVQDEKEVEVGEDATLDCQGPHEGNILWVAWTKSDLKADDYVFFFREDRLYKTYQHELFKGRVELEDPNMKSGKMSIILHNITVNDAGTYECHISYETDHSQRSEMKQETKLKVTPAVQRQGARKEGAKKDGSVGLLSGLSVSSLLLIVAAIGYLV